MRRKILGYLLLLLVVFSLCGCSAESGSTENKESASNSDNIEPVIDTNNDEELASEIREFAYKYLIKEVFPEIKSNLTNPDTFNYLGGYCSIDNPNVVEDIYDTEYLDDTQDFHYNYYIMFTAKSGLGVESKIYWRYSKSPGITRPNGIISETTDETKYVSVAQRYKEHLKGDSQYIPISEDIAYFNGSDRTQDEFILKIDKDDLEAYIY